MPTTLPIRIAVPASTVKDIEADGSITVIFLVTTLGMLLSVLAALMCPECFLGF